MQSEGPVLTPRLHQAVIFDLDGVVTRTARLHAAAWKQTFDEYLQQKQGANWQAFDDVEDYRHYVDGKPRYDGTRSFLQSRGIHLPEGEPDDPPDRETVCGIGNRKNARFLELLKREGAESYASTLTLIHVLRQAGIRTAVVSSSRNCVAVLESVDALHLFDAKVDGVDAEEAGLEGKPAPDIFLEAARRLGVSPQHAVVVEDAIAGVEAGRAGGFVLIIGVDRTGHAHGLRVHGADVVVVDLAQVSVEDSAPPLAMESLPAILDDVGDRQLAVFLDYDGTLTPIVDQPSQAILSDAMRSVLQRLAAACPLAIVSGRDMADVRQRVAVEGIWYAGSHGFDIAGPDGSGHAPEAAREAIPQLDAAEAELRQRLDQVDGALLERKRFALAVHYRMVKSAADEEKVAQAVDDALAERPQLRKGQGKKVYELLPDLDWNKGAALSWLRRTLGLAHAGVAPIYVGDDVTDEDAFAVLRDDGIGILVAQRPRPTAARYRLENPEAVRRFLDALAERLEQRS